MQTQDILDQAHASLHVKNEEAAASCALILAKPMEQLLQTFPNKYPSYDTVCQYTP